MKSLSFILSIIVLLKDSSYPVTKTDYLCTCKEEFEVFWMNLYVNEQVMIVFYLNDVTRDRGVKIDIRLSTEEIYSN